MQARTETAQDQAGFGDAHAATGGGGVLAAVLFLVDIGSSFQLCGVRYAPIAFGTTLLIFSIV
jgi:hypothetical protein